MAVGNFPPFFSLDERELVWIVSVDLVRRGKDERRGRAMSPRVFQEDQGSCRVDRKIGFRLLSSPVVGRLGRGVDDYFDAVSVVAEDSRNLPSFADIRMMVHIARQGLLQVLTAP